MPSLTINKMLTALGCLSALLTSRASAQAGADGDWTMPARDYASTRFSKLAQVPMPPDSQVPDPDLHAIVKWVLTLK